LATVTGRQADHVPVVALRVRTLTVPFTRARGASHTTPTMLNLGVDWAGAFASVAVVRSFIVWTCPSIGPAAAAGAFDAPPFQTTAVPAPAAATTTVTMIAVRLRTRTFIHPPRQDRSTSYSASEANGVTGGTAPG
jgi:hypothetical protein